LQARERHVNTLFEGLPPVALAAVVLLTASSQTNAAPLVWGTNVGIALQIAFLVWYLAKARDLRWSPRGAAWSADSSSIVRAMLAVLGGQLAMGIIVPIDQYFASGYGEGAIASLGYVNRFTILLFGVGATAIARGLLPVLSRVVTNGSIGSAGKVTMSWALLAFTAGALLAAGTTIFASPLIALVLERGAFSSADTAMVASLLRGSIWQLPFYFAGIVFAQFLVSVGHYRIFVITGVVNLIVKVGANAILVPRLGLMGLMIGSVLMYAVSCASLTWSSHRALRASQARAL